MKNLLLLYFLFVAPLALAKDSRDLVNFLDHLNREMNVPKRGVQCEGLEATDEENLYQCAIDLCGKPEDLVTGAINEKNIDQYIESDVSKRLREIIEPVKKLSEKKKKEEERFITAFEERLKNPAFVDFSKWDKADLNSTSIYVYYENFNLDIDKTKPLSERVKLNITYPEDASEEYKKGLKEYAENNLKDKTTRLSSAYYAEIYTDEELINKYYELAKFFVDFYDKNYKKNPGEYDSWEDEVKKYRALKPEDVKKEDVSNSGWIEYQFKKLSEKVGKENPIQEIEICQDHCRKGVISTLQSLDIPKKISDLKEKLANESEESVLNNCKAELLSKGLKQSDKEKFLTNFPKVKKNFIAKAMAGSSAHSREAFERYLEERIHLSFKAYETGGVDEFITDLQKKSTEETTPRDYASDTNVNMMTSLLNRRSWEDRTEINPDTEVCRESDLYAVWDAFAPQKYIENPQHDEDPTKDNIFVSLFSCTHETHGKGVVSHEMGHALSYALFEKMLSESTEVAYNEVRKCVTKAYVDPLPGDEGLLNREGDSLRTEEDMADVMSYLAMDDENVNYLCALLDTDMKGSKFIDVNLINSIPEDTHSSALHRALMEALYKKRQISSSCKKVMESHKDTFRFGPCLQK